MKAIWMMTRTFTAIVAAGLLLSAASTAAQESSVEEMFKEETTDRDDNPLLAAVNRSGSKCQMLYLGGPSVAGFTLVIGKTAQDSRFVILGTEKIGETDDSFRLDMMRSRGWAPAGTARYEISEQAGGQYSYEAGVMTVRIDFETVKKAGYFRFQPNGRPGGSITFPFNGELRDKTVNAMERCLSSQQSYWSLGN